MKCTNGRVVRPATFKADTSTGAKDYTLNLVMRGTTRTVDHLKVVEAGKTDNDQHDNDQHDNDNAAPRVVLRHDLA